MRLDVTIPKVVSTATKEDDLLPSGRKESPGSLPDSRTSQPGQEESGGSLLFAGLAGEWGYTFVF